MANQPGPKRWKRPDRRATKPATPATPAMEAAAARGLDAHTIEGAWRSYREACVSPGAGPDQLRATRQAFYGGFGVCLAYFDRISEPDVDEEQGVGFLERFRREFEAYSAALKAGEEPADA